MLTGAAVDDHCGYVFPWDPLQFFFNNNAQYHDIHHQSYGFTKNFSQPFFTFCKCSARQAANPGKGTI